MELLSMVGFGMVDNVLSSKSKKPPSFDTAARVHRFVHAAALHSHRDAKTGGPKYKNRLKSSTSECYRSARVGGNNGRPEDLQECAARYGSTSADCHLPRQTGHFWLLPLCDESGSYAANVPIYISPEQRKAVALTRHRAKPVCGIDADPKDISSILETGAKGKTRQLVLHASDGTDEYRIPLEFIRGVAATRVTLCRIYASSGLPMLPHVVELLAYNMAERERLGLLAMPSNATKATAASLIDEAGARCDVVDSLVRICHQTINAERSCYHYDEMGCYPESKVAVRVGL